MRNLVAQYWWLWLAGSIFFGSLAVLSHDRRVKKMADGVSQNVPFEILARDFYSGIGLAFLWTFLAWAFLFILIISVIMR